MLCAGYHKTRGGCQGDSGGPLACEEYGRWVLRGAVSWGRGDCSPSYYTVFARVSTYVPWIEDIMAGTSLSNTSV
jgi:secreted trypsin-like serine protease